MLHILKDSPFDKPSSLQACLRFFKEKQDILILIENGIIASLKNTSWLNNSAKIIEPIYALESDIILRDMPNKIHPHILVIDYTQFIDFLLTNQPIIYW